MEYVGVAGHNEIVPGAYGCGYAEHAVARQMLAKVISYMNAVGETMHNCTDDVGRTQSACWQNAASNTNRAIGSNGKAISIHLNAANSNATGTEVLHYNNPELAAKVSAKIAGVLGIKDRGPKDGKSIGYINSTKAEAILIELCFIDNPSDMKKLMDNFDAVAIAIVEAITGKSVQNGGGIIVTDNGYGYKLVATGGIGFDKMQETANFLNKLGYGAAIHISGKNDGLFSIRTERRIGSELDKLTAWLDNRPGGKWWYQYE
ncbi:N-acetylmuramoyl-L-alanine amidase [Bacillus sp. JJ1127]|uniref:N-acetylmuramoyl-L-alanine amidase n=1 Tax=Bacillus sp. JJ1127 TaxID=3122952 RepID=UPI002FFFBD47